MADQVEAKAVIKVSADTKQAVQAITGLTKAQQGLTEEVKKTKKTFAEQVDVVASGFAKFNLAAGGISTAFQMLGKGIDAAFTEARLAAQEKLLAPGTVQRLQGAVDGLIPRTAILGLAVKSMTGDFALTETQMSKVMRAAIALEQKGYGPAVQIAEKLNDALVNGVNRLDDFGIDLEKTDDRLGDVNRAMGSFDDLIRGTPVDERTASLKRLQVTMNDIAEAFNRLAGAAAGAVVTVGNALGSAAGQVLYGSVIDDSVFASDAENEAHFAAKRAARKAARERRAAEAGLLRSEDDAEYAAQFGAGYDDSPFADRYNYDPTYKRPKRDPGAGRTRRNVYGEDVSGDLGSWSGLGAGEMGPEMFHDRDTTEGFAAQFGGVADEVGRLAREGEPALKFMRDLQDSATMTGQAFGVFSDAFAAAVGAAIDGSKGIGEAFVDAAAVGLKAMAIDHAVRALGEGAFALTSLAFGDAKGAALHGAAAGKHALAAAAAGAGSAALGAIAGGLGGGGGGGSGAAAGGAAGNYSAGPGGEQNAGTVIINLGDGFIGDPKQVEEHIYRGINRAKQRGARENYAVTFEGG
jgi:hypothetical protein